MQNVSTPSLPTKSATRVIRYGGQEVAIGVWLLTFDADAEGCASIVSAECVDVAGYEHIHGEAPPVGMLTAEEFRALVGDTALAGYETEIEAMLAERRADERRHGEADMEQQERDIREGR